MRSKGDWSGVADKLRGMEVGEAFFLPYRQLKDVTNLYNIARRAKVSISIRSVELDEVEMKPGVRVTKIATPEVSD